MEIIKTGRQIGKTLRNASRLKNIVSVFAKHGFHNIAERIKLGRYIIERLYTSTDLDKYSVAERIRMCFEELGPTFVKLGQLLATRPDLVPDDLVSEFSKLHDKVNPLPFDVIETVLKEEFGENLSQYFLSIDQNPLGSASIAQVHKAVLIGGENVVIKVQRPGIINTINDDLNVLYFLAELIDKYVDEMKPFNIVGIVDEYFKTLELETNFVVEANNIRRFSDNFSNFDKIRIPKVYFSLTRERVLTMEALDGIPLTSDLALKQEGVDSTEILRIGLRAYLKMVFTDGLFHGDIHAGNFFVMSNNSVGLIDFGVVGRLSKRTQSAITRMLLALSREDYEQFAYEYIDLSPFNESVNVDIFARDLRNLIAPYYGLTLKNVNFGKILMSSSSVAAKHHLSVPTELMLFFKSIVSIEGLGRKIDANFDFLANSLEFASELIKKQYDPSKIMTESSHLLKESSVLLTSLPRQLNYFIRKMNSPSFAKKIQIKEMDDVKKSIELSFNLLFLGILIGSLLLSSSLLVNIPTENRIGGLPSLSFVGYVSALILSLIAFLNYIKK